MRIHRIQQIKMSTHCWLQHSASQQGYRFHLRLVSVHLPPPEGNIPLSILSISPVACSVSCPSSTTVAVVLGGTVISGGTVIPSFCSKDFIKLLSAENPLALADGMNAVLLNQHLA